MLSFIGGLLSSFGFGSANVVIKKTLSNQDTAKILFPATFSGIFFILFLTFFSGVETFSWEIILQALILGIFETIVYLSLYKTFEVANVSTATALINIYPVLSLLFAALVFGEIIQISKVLFIVTIIVGAILTSIRWDEVFMDGFDRSDLVKGFKWIILCLILNALYFPILGRFTEQGIWEYRLLIIKICSAFFMFFLFFIINKKDISPSKSTFIPSIMVGLLEVMGWVGFSWAVSIRSELPQAIIIATLSSAALVTAIGAYFFLNEKLTKLQYLGILIIVVSLTGLSY